jgi:Predicted ATPase related to phosphate starvation-inducible protein PhoH
MMIIRKRRFDLPWKKGNIQFKSLNFIRGRSIQDAMILLDESQNLTPQQLKTIITRCGKGSKNCVFGESCADRQQLSHRVNLRVDLCG